MILCLCPNPSVDKFVWLKTFNRNESNRYTKEQHFPGGKGIHVANAIKELGENVCILGFWAGPTGRWLKDQCEKKGIKCYGPEIKGWSRICTTLRSPLILQDTELLGEGPKITKKHFTEFIHIFKELLPTVKCVTMSGSWPKGAPLSAYSHLIEIATNYGIKSFLDCSGLQLKKALLTKPYLVHINKSEGEALFNGKNTVEIATSLSKYCDYAAVTAGADGLYYASGSKIFHASCKVEKILSAVGSGDCLLAGLTVAYIRGMNMADSSRIGVACGSANCVREDLGMLYKSDVEIFLNKVCVTNISKQILVT